MLDRNPGSVDVVALLTLCRQSKAGFIDWNMGVATNALLSSLASRTPVALCVRELHR